MEFKFEPDTRDLWDRLTCLDCCGIKELSRLKGLTQKLGSTENVAKAVAKVVVGQILKSAFLVFSEVRGGGTYGTDLKAFILAKGLGTVIQSETVENPNSGNYITVYLWWMDRNALRAWHGCTCPVCVEAMRFASVAGAATTSIPTPSATSIPF